MLQNAALHRAAGVDCTPAELARRQVRFWSSLAWMHGHGPQRPRDIAGIGEKWCIKSTRLKILAH